MLLFDQVSKIILPPSPLRLPPLLSYKRHPIKHPTSDVRAHCGGGMDNPVEVDMQTTLSMGVLDLFGVGTP